VIPKAALQRLKDAPWLHKPETQQVFALLDGADGRTRAVGGVVRDTLGEAPRAWAEIDFATELVPEDVISRADAAGLAVYPTGIEHGTVTLRVGDLTAEVTTLREDIETDGRHARVRFGTDWRRDAERRDFTLNALYAGMDGELFDPINGAEDCLAGVVRFIGSPDQRIVEDRLRVYRFFRFSASHGHEQFNEEGLEAVSRAAGALGDLSAERVGNEMRRILQLPKVARTFRAMAETHVLQFPPAMIDRLAAYERHAHRPEVAARLAVLMSLISTERLRDMWRLSNDEVSSATNVLTAARLLIDFHINEAAYRYPAALADALEVAATLAGWTSAGRSAVVQHLEKIEVPRFPLTGRDLIKLGYKPGPALGVELDRLERKWIESSFVLDRSALLANARR
jgi:poly(A) polymerase